MYIMVYIMVYYCTPHCVYYVNFIYAYFIDLFSTLVNLGCFKCAPQIKVELSWVEYSAKFASKSRLRDVNLEADCEERHSAYFSQTGGAAPPAGPDETQPAGRRGRARGSIKPPRSRRKKTVRTHRQTDRQTPRDSPGGTEQARSSPVSRCGACRTPAAVDVACRPKKKKKKN